MEMRTHFGEALAEFIEKRGAGWTIEQLRMIERIAKEDKG
jgi:hypothetical protein